MCWLPGHVCWLPGHVCWLPGHVCWLPGHVCWLPSHVCWLPGHVAIKCNEIAASAAKFILQLSVSSNKIPHFDLKCYISKFKPDRFKLEWDVATINKLRSIKRTFHKTRCYSHLSRNEDVVLRRIRIGHRNLTHDYLFYKEEQEPKCLTCRRSLTQ